jgi:hypothetical protein
MQGAASPGFSGAAAYEVRPGICLLPLHEFFFGSFPVNISTLCEETNDETAHRAGKGNTLKICWSASGQERPTEMAAKARSSHALITLNRTKLDR